MQYTAIFDNDLLEKKIEEIRALSLTLNESQLNSPFHSKYPKHVFAPLEDYLNEAFMKGLLQRGKNFIETFTKGAKEIASKIGDSIKEFSFKKIFMTVTKMMHKIKSKMLKSLMVLLEPLRKVIIENDFCDEDNKFNTKTTFRKLVALAKEVGKPAGSEELLSDQVVLAIQKNANLEGLGALRESEESEAEAGKAKFDDKDVKYLDFFQKMMFKLGIKDAKLNGFLSEISKKVATGAAVTGVFALLGAFLPTAGIIASIASAAGAAVAAAPILVMIIGAILFGIGLFMFATWLLKPYPTIENCRIFLGTILSGAHPFDFPDVDLDSFTRNMEPAEETEPIKPIFNTDLIIDLEDEGVEEDIPGATGDDLVKEVRNTIDKYDELDIDMLEDEKAVSENIRLARTFVRNISTVNGRSKIQDMIDNIREDEEDNDYVEAIEKFVEIIDEIYAGEAVEEETEDGKKKYPFALNYKNVQSFLKSRENTVADRMTKVIDVTDNYIDRIDKIAKEK